MTQIVQDIIETVKQWAGIFAFHVAMYQSQMTLVD